MQKKPKKKLQLEKKTSSVGILIDDGSCGVDFYWYASLWHCI